MTTDDLAIEVRALSVRVEALERALLALAEAADGSPGTQLAGFRDRIRAREQARKETA